MALRPASATVQPTFATALYRKAKQNLEAYPILDWTDRDIYNYLQDMSCPTTHFGIRAMYLLATGTARASWTKA